MKKILKKIDIREVISYLIIGVLTTIVSLVSYYLLTTYILNPDKPIELQIANVLSWILSVTFAYFTNRKYVFRSNNKNVLKEGMKFYSARLLTLFMDMLIMFVLVSLMGINDKIIKLLSQVVVVIANYVISKFMVFKKSK
jgi:putative flippase GtrA